MERRLKTYIQEDLKRKIILITGPRQCGKTTLSKMLFSQYAYYNYDNDEDRLILNDKAWDRDIEGVIFDELHKKHEWKRWLKGIYDVDGIPPAMVVTGSAKLDTYRKVGDSLAGRYFKFHLHPFDIQEAMVDFSVEEAFRRLWSFGPFPEPFLEANHDFYRRWKRTHRDIILRQDLIDFAAVRDIQDLETLIKLIETRVGGTVNYSNLGQDIERNGNTIKRWVTHLENVYIVFRVQPYSSTIARSIRKDSKLYLYDYASIADEGAKLENLVASTLLKHCHYIESTKGLQFDLQYLRTKDGREIDFVILKENKPVLMIEVKHGDRNVSKHVSYFQRYLPNVPFVQLSKKIQKPMYISSLIEVHPVAKWLAELDLMSY